MLARALPWTRRPVAGRVLRHHRRAALRHLRRRAGHPAGRVPAPGLSAGGALPAAAGGHLRRHGGRAPAHGPGRARRGAGRRRAAAARPSPPAAPGAIRWPSWPLRWPSWPRPWSSAWVPPASCTSCCARPCAAGEAERDIVPGHGQRPLRAALPGVPTLDARRLPARRWPARWPPAPGCRRSSPTRPPGGSFRLIAVLRRRRRRAPCACPPPTWSDAYPALTPDCPQAHWFEREIAEQWGVAPRGPPLAQAHPLPRPAEPQAPGRRPRGRACGDDRLLPRGGRGGPRGGRRAGARRASSSRGTSASSATARTSSTWRSRWATSTAASSAPCRRARTCAAIHLRGDPGRRHHHRPRHGLLPGRWRPWPAAACRRGPRPSAASPWSWSASPTTSATWARWPATWASCRPRPTAGASAATS